MTGAGVLPLSISAAGDVGYAMINGLAEVVGSKIACERVSAVKE